MNPWGIVVMGLGLATLWIGIRGTQGNVFADLFGRDYVPAGTSDPTKPQGTAISGIVDAVGGLWPSTAPPVHPLPAPVTLPWWVGKLGGPQ